MRVLGENRFARDVPFTSRRALEAGADHQQGVARTQIGVRVPIHSENDAGTEAAHVGVERHATPRAAQALQVAIGA
jgi:hypothetical protein